MTPGSAHIWAIVNALSELLDRFTAIACRLTKTSGIRKAPTHDSESQPRRIVCSGGVGMAGRPVQRPVAVRQPAELDRHAKRHRRHHESIDAIGIDLHDVFLTLENEGVDKFKDAWSKGP
jgi:hypothetical protein